MDEAKADSSETLRLLGLIRAGATSRSDYDVVLSQVGSEWPIGR
jgi:hypothetical protein